MNEWHAHSLLVSSFMGIGIPQAKIAFEQREFTPPADGSLWYALFNLPASRSPLTLGDVGEDEFVGVFQADVRAEQGKGVKEALEAAAAITSYYKAGRRFTDANGSIMIRRAEISPVRRDGVRVVVSVSVYWRALLQR